MEKAALWPAKQSPGPPRTGLTEDGLPRGLAGLSWESREPYLWKPLQCVALSLETPPWTEHMARAPTLPGGLVSGSFWPE